jgi:hypothetical protein
VTQQFVVRQQPRPKTKHIPQFQRLRLNRWLHVKWILIQPLLHLSSQLNRLWRPKSETNECILKVYLWFTYEILYVLRHLLLIYICKLHWNTNTMFVCQVQFLLIYIWVFHVLSHLLLIYICKLHWIPSFLTVSIRPLFKIRESIRRSSSFYRN